MFFTLPNGLALAGEVFRASINASDTIACALFLNGFFFPEPEDLTDLTLPTFGGYAHFRWTDDWAGAANPGLSRYDLNPDVPATFTTTSVPSPAEFIRGYALYDFATDEIIGRELLATAIEIVVVGQVIQVYPTVFFKSA